MKIDRWLAQRQVKVMSSGMNHISDLHAAKGSTTDRPPFRDGVYRIEVKLANGCLVWPPCSRVHYVKDCV